MQHNKLEGGDQKESCEVERSAGRESLLRSEGANDGVTGAELLRLYSTVLLPALASPTTSLSSQRPNLIDTADIDVSNTYSACIATGLRGP